MLNGMNRVTEAAAREVAANQECGENAPTDREWYSGQSGAEKTNGDWKS